MSRVEGQHSLETLSWGALRIVIEIPGMNAGASNAPDDALCKINSALVRGPLSPSPFPPEGQGELADFERENTSILPSPSGGKGGGLGAEKQNRAERMNQRA
jgi:hypothetical protein